MKDYEDETRDARRAAKAAEESPRMAKSELRAARKERDQYIARYSHITDAHPGTVVHVSNLQWQRMLYIRNPNRFFIYRHERGHRLIGVSRGGGSLTLSTSHAVPS